LAGAEELTVRRKIMHLLAGIKPKARRSKLTSDEIAALEHLLERVRVLEVERPELSLPDWIRVAIGEQPERR
jgi:hypothetical protein